MYTKFQYCWLVILFGGHLPKQQARIVEEVKNILEIICVRNQMLALEILVEQVVQIVILVMYISQYNFGNQVDQISSFYLPFFL